MSNIPSQSSVETFPGLDPVTAMAKNNPLFSRNLINLQKSEADYHSEFDKRFNNALKEARLKKELDDLKKELDNLKKYMKREMMN